MLSSSISLLWPQLTHITHISSQIVGPTMGTLLHLSLISWLGKSPTHSDCCMYAFCSDSPNSQVLLRAHQMLCSIRRQTISNLSPPRRWFLLTNIRQPWNENPTRWWSFPLLLRTCEHATWLSSSKIVWSCAEVERAGRGPSMHPVIRFFTLSHRFC